MTSSRTPGPTGFGQAIPDLNDGTLARARSPLPGAVGIEAVPRSRLTLESTQTSSLAGTSVQTDERRVIRSLQGKSNRLTVGRDAFRLIRAAEWPKFQNNERYELVEKHEALLVFEEGAEQRTISPVEKAAFQEAASLLADTHVRLTDTGLLLLRRLRARVIQSSSAEAPVTPSQLAKMFAKEKEQEEHWIEIELLYDDGACVEGEKYVIVTPDGQEKTGVTNAYGRARVDGIPLAGRCKITFPDIHGNEWRTA